MKNYNREMTKATPVLWFNKEEDFLRKLHQVCTNLSKQYLILYKRTYRKQTKLRLPAIILSSFSGVASFGNTSFPADYQRYVSIIVGLINISIAMIQTYESYLKIADTVAKSLTVSINLKKLADDIYCEVYIPIEDRETNGITFLRDCFSRYGAIIYQAPPLDSDDDDEHDNEATNLIQKISEEIHRHDKVMRIEHGKQSQIKIASTPKSPVSPRSESFNNITSLDEISIK